MQNIGVFIKSLGISMQEIVSVREQVKQHKKLLAANKKQLDQYKELLAAYKKLAVEEVGDEWSGLIVQDSRRTCRLVLSCN
jgi:hypothetical protein